MTVKEIQLEVENELTAEENKLQETEGTELEAEDMKLPKFESSHQER